MPIPLTVSGAAECCVAAGDSNWHGELGQVEASGYAVSVALEATGSPQLEENMGNEGLQVVGIEKLIFRCSSLFLSLH